jgi:transcription antitermination factor NusB
MKGRRQARRAALQALYELDQSTHEIETILAARVEALLESGLDSALPADRRSLSRQVLARAHGPHLDAGAVHDTALALGAREADVAGVARVLDQLAPLSDYLDAIVRGVARHRAVLDATIERIAPEWPVAQMAPVDRNILRIALWEIATGASPLRVCINEAVELARAFSGEGARRMVNGALGAYVAAGRKLELPHDEAAMTWPGDGT